VPVTNAERQARFRERQAERVNDAAATVEALDRLTTRLVDLTAAIVTLADALHNGASRYVTPRNGAEGAGTHTRALDPGPRPLRGLGGPVGVTDGVTVQAPTWDVRADAHRVALVLEAPGSVASIRDAIGARWEAEAPWPNARIAAALVYLQDHGQVKRIPGQAQAIHGHYPDTWAPLPDLDLVSDPVTH